MSESIEKGKVFYHTSGLDPDAFLSSQVGWSGTADFKEQWVYDGAAETYAFDPEMAELLAKNNPEAFRNIVKRMLEANGRGYWNASDEVSPPLICDWPISPPDTAKISHCLVFRL